ncbi:MAG: hypothetical protein IPN79_00700 [Saprospiraceae bacterium]|nr:hypothetical protein [Saprospiraceae bacterium]
MITVDLSQRNKQNVKRIIAENIGLPEKKIFGIDIAPGISGIVFEDRVGDHLIRYKVAIEKYPKGLAMFFRSVSNSFLVLLPYADIVSVSFHKDEDMISESTVSWFRMVRKLGINYDKAKKFILESEKQIVHLSRLSITTKENVTFELIATSLSQQKAETFLNSISSEVQVSIQYKEFRII